MNYKLRIIKTGIVSSFIIYNLLICNSTQAATASFSAKPSPQATASASLLEKINEIKEKAASKAADLLSEVTKKLQNKAYFGIISSLDGDNLTVSFLGNDKKIAANEYTVLSSTLKTAKKALVLKDFVVGDFVSGLGDVDDKEILKAKKLVKSAPIASDSAKLVWGTIQSAKSGTIILKIADTTNQTITASGQTKVFLGQEEGSLLDVKSGRVMIARGKESKDRIISATYIYVVPQTANAKPEKKPEASFSASPSASPKKK